MINSAMNAVARELNEFFRNSEARLDDCLIISNLVDQQGNPPGAVENKIVFLLTAISREKHVTQPPPVRRSDAPNIPSAQYPIQLNLTVMFASMFTNYEAGLRTLSAVIAYLQEKPVLNHENSPMLDAAIEKLTFEMLPLDASQQSRLWVCLGARYVPSVVYSMHLLLFPASGPERGVAGVAAGVA